MMSTLFGTVGLFWSEDITGPMRTFRAIGRRTRFYGFSVGKLWLGVWRSHYEEPDERQKPRKPTCKINRYRCPACGADRWPIRPCDCMEPPNVETSA